MADHPFCPQHCLAEEGFFLESLPGWFRLDSIPSLTNVKPFRSVFLVLGLPQVLGLGPWSNTCIDSGCLAFYPHNSPSRSFFPTPWGGKEDLDVIVAPFLSFLNVRRLLNYPSRVLTFQYMRYAFIKLLQIHVPHFKWRDADPTVWVLHWNLSEIRPAQNSSSPLWISWELH